MLFKFKLHNSKVRSHVVCLEARSLSTVPQYKYNPVVHFQAKITRYQSKVCIGRWLMSVFCVYLGSVLVLIQLIDKIYIFILNISLNYM